MAGVNKNDNKASSNELKYRPIKEEDFEPGIKAELLAMGFKEEHFSHWQVKPYDYPMITEAHVNFIRFLLEKTAPELAPDFDKIIQEINRLNSVEAEILLKLYDEGLRAEHLLESHQSGGDRLISSEREMWHYLLVEKNLPAKEVAEELQALSTMQMKALKLCYDFGLRAEHLRAWQGPANQSNFFEAKFSEEHVKMLEKLLNQKKPVSPREAVEIISHISVTSLQDPAKLDRRIKQIHEHIVAPTAAKKLS